MEKLIAIKNRNFGWTGYTIPDRNIIRRFSPGETKNVPLEELQALQWTEGGDILLKNCFLIKDQSALEALSMNDLEPEYFYTEVEIKTLMETGTLEQLEDTLNFAPEGVIEMIKNYAVKNEIPDTRKRKLISDKTGFNIDNAIRVNQIMNEESESVVEDKAKQRKAAPITAAGAPERKAPAPNPNKYKIASH